MACVSVLAISRVDPPCNGKVTYRLAQWPTLPDSHLITLLNTKGRRDVCCKILVSLLVSGVLGNEVEVFAANDEGSVHFGRDDGAGEDTSADRDFASEGAFLI